MNALIEKGLSVEVLTDQDWKLFHVADVLRRLRSGAFDIVHIQYPGLGYAKHLGPPAISLIRDVVVTLHEFSHVHLLRRVASIPFCLRSQVIFTTEYERQNAIAKMPFLVRRSQVIPIGSNIQKDTSTLEKRHFQEIVYFGLIVPKKGIEDVIKLAAVVKAQRLPYRIRVIGRIVHAVRELVAYAGNLLQSTKDLPIDWSIDLTEDEVAVLLGKTAFAYLPYPDGASERRGSLKAALAAGAVCITTKGPQTTQEILNATLIGQTPNAALQAIEELTRDRAKWLQYSLRTYKYAEAFEWTNIADLHINLYAHIMGLRSSGFATPNG
ncbi:hypothetical protein [Alloacidobacterium sp.]|uniref:hypothetical protein n=1 Tax=Alloacidobacterium sp. TaxID=2951999 RepID=UPI002D5AFE3B|nr:hypothetical protein [Alloacidobacterium sp.]HYK37960.1 hypothetical protein [Alloacidobacterium sp.]